MFNAGIRKSGCNSKNRRGGSTDGLEGQLANRCLGRMHTRVLLCFAFVLAFACVALAGSSDKVSARLKRKAFAASEYETVWVYFTDKALTGKARRNAINEVRSALPAKTLERRSKVGKSVEEYDLPVSDSYVQEVLATGSTLRVTSNWLNAISIKVNQQQFSEIAQMSFVAKIEPVATKSAEVDPKKEATTPQPVTEHKRDATDFYGASREQLEQINVIAAQEGMLLRAHNSKCLALFDVFVTSRVLWQGRHHVVLGRWILAGARNFLTPSCDCYTL